VTVCPDVQTVELVGTEIVIVPSGVGAGDAELVEPWLEEDCELHPAVLQAATL